MKYLNISIPTVFNGVNFKVPILGKTGYSNAFMTEIWMSGLLKNLLSLKEGVFIDVGVNIGQTLLKLRSIDSEKEYFGFEPNPSCVQYTERLINQNKFKHSSIFPFGISNKSEIGVLNFFHQGDTDSTASIIPNFRLNQKIVKKQYVPLYDISYFEKFIEGKSVSILKIDVEGAELEVLASFSSLLEIYKPFLLIEILPAYDDSNKIRIDRQNEIKNILHDSDYSILRISKSKLRIDKFIPLDDFGIHSDLALCDYVCVHKSYLKSLLSINFSA
ncbi:FkbM family methyltransferase [Vicingaceae bacterium]|nr:FkbM family methyltransferase [Vicingaceae bacterium]